MIHPSCLNPVQYQLFRHRLFNVLEEGRIAMKMVSGSPVVVEGGETMSAIYDAEGTPILVAAGILLHAMGAKDFIRRCIEMYQENPGIHEGDQFFFNDPYIGGQHLPDMVVVKPIFYQGELIAWAGSIMHTGETGGIAPGGMPPFATEIFHEGIKILGLKVVERGKFRLDVFNTIIHQCRAPHLVGLDLKARIASNNVCAKNYLLMVEQYGLEFVKQASRKIIEDSELEARARLRSLPDGTWRSRHYGDTNGLTEKPFKVVCTMTKKGDRITFDYTGSSPQNEGSLNSTYGATWGSLFVALASQLFWNIAWNGGMFAPVKLIAPEGTVVNCRYPAAVSTGVASVGCMITQTAHECIAKMLYAGGEDEDVNSGWMGGHGNPYFGGINRSGEPIAGVILDTFAGGTGASPFRDGVHTGANMMNPQSNISDVEMIELNLPFLYLYRREATDSGGFGRFNGGVGGEAAYMAYDAPDFRIGIQGVGSRTPTGHGIFGGYPPGLLDSVFVRGAAFEKAFHAGRYPGSREEILELAEESGGRIEHVPMSTRPQQLQNYEVLICPWSAGGGFGDPLERTIEEVELDVRRGFISRQTAEVMYGVFVDEHGCADLERTYAMRERMRRERLQEGAMPRADTSVS